MAITRYEHLLEWMADRFIIFADLGERLGMTASAARQMCLKETMPIKHYEAMLLLGFPSELLPLPLDVKPGRRRHSPIFPGLQKEQPQA